MKLSLQNIKQFMYLYKENWMRVHCVFLVKFLYGDIWNLREKCAESHDDKSLNLYYSYMDYYGASINYQVEIDGVPTFPHGIIGVFISRYAQIGKDCVIFQHVTIGSNALKDSKLRIGGVSRRRCYDRSRS